MMCSILTVLTSTPASFHVIFYFMAEDLKDNSSLTGTGGSDVYLLAKDLAALGNIVFNVEYRRGNLQDHHYPQQYTSAQDPLANYRGGQDGRGALRYILLTQIDQYQRGITDPFQFDTGKVFIGGASAGAI